MSIVVVVVEGSMFLGSLKEGDSVSNLHPIIFSPSVLNFFFSVYDVKRNSYSVSETMKQLPHSVLKKQHEILYETHPDIRFKPLRNGLRKPFCEKKLKFMENGIRIPFRKKVKRIL